MRRLSLAFALATVAALWRQRFLRITDIIVIHDDVGRG